MIEQLGKCANRPSVVTIDAGNPAEVRRLAHEIAMELSEDASAALREFLANVREHCPCKDVDIVQLPSLLVAYDHGGGIRDGHTRKPAGEGGYGLKIMHSLGAELRRWEEGTMFVMTL
ncbi:MAG TPA: hypothetical protein VGM37_16875 [Armatimonadota bacterium]|jgi:hypothetical protein